MSDRNSSSVRTASVPLSLGRSHIVARAMITAAIQCSWSGPCLTARIFEIFRRKKSIPLKTANRLRTATEWSVRPQVKIFPVEWNVDVCAVDFFITSIWIKDRQQKLKLEEIIFLFSATNTLDEAN